MTPVFIFHLSIGLLRPPLPSLLAKSASAPIPEPAAIIPESESAELAQGFSDLLQQATPFD